MSIRTAGAESGIFRQGQKSGWKQEAMAEEKERRNGRRSRTRTANRTAGIKSAFKGTPGKAGGFQANGKDPFVHTKYDVDHITVQEIKENFEELEGKQYPSPDV